LAFAAKGAENEIGREMWSRDDRAWCCSGCNLEGGLQNYLLADLDKLGSAAIYGLMEKNKMGKDFGKVSPVVKPKGLQAAEAQRRGKKRTI
jgi:hypothetical protein